MKHSGTFSQAMSWWMVVCLLAGGQSALAVDILDTAENIFYQTSDQSRMGIEVELRGLEPDQVAKEVKTVLGGTIETKFEDTKTDIRGYDQDGMPEYNTIKTKYFLLRGTSVGDLVLKPDYNQKTDKFDASEIVTEIVSPPIRMKEVEKLEGALAHLKAKGAVGTYPKGAPPPGFKGKVESIPVSAQVNVEWAGGDRSKIRAIDLVNLLRSYSRPEHRQQISDHLQVPESRKPYVDVFSLGFMKKLLDPKYSPDFRQLYDDFIYRQSLERLYQQTQFDHPPTAEQRKLIAKGKDAWTMPIEEARSTLIALKDLAVVPTVVKQNALRVSSLLMYMQPDDYMTKLYDATGWAKARPLVEFREWNNEFTIVSEAKQALGLVEAAKKYGYYDHDQLLSEISTMDKKAIQDLRKSANEQGRSGKSVFRYYLGDPKTVDRSDYAKQTTYYKVGDVGFLPYGTYGQAPVRIPGESVVFHRRPMHRFSVEGKYNPGLINHNVTQALENKYAEAMFWKKYAPGTMPETRNLKSFRETKSPESLIRKLNSEFPGGWVMKGAWDLGSEKDIITDKTDVVQALKRYDPVAFERRRKALEKKYSGISDTAPEYLQSELKKDPGYQGWRISQLLANPDLVMVQRKVPIEREFRVEVIAGKVLANGSTVDRFKYMYETGVDGLTMKDYQAPSAADLKRVEAFAQQAVDKLPPELRGMPFGMDIALLKDGKIAMIESNPGGNSNFLFEEDRAGVVALGKFLERYPDSVKSGKIDRAVAEGMDPKAQMEFLKGFFAEQGIDPARQYPGIRFLPDRMEDPEFKRAVPSREEYVVEGKPARRSQSAESVSFALRRDQVRNPRDTMSVEEARRAVESRVKALSQGRSNRDFQLSSVKVRFDASIPDHLEGELKLTPEREAIISLRQDSAGRVSREAVEEELRHLDQVRKSPDKILSRSSSDPLLIEAMESHVKASRVSRAGKTSVGTGLAQSLMSIIMSQDLKERGLEDKAGYHWVQGVGDADDVANLVIRKPLQSASLRLARGALGLGAQGLGMYGAGMSAAALAQALKEGDNGQAISSAMKTGVLGGSVTRQLARPMAERVLSAGARMAARKAATAGAAEVLGAMTGPVGLTALAVGDMAAMAVEWRTEAYYGSIEKIYSQTQFEKLRLGPSLQRDLMVPAGIQGSLKSIQTNVQSDEQARQTRFNLEAKSLARGLAEREVLGLSTEPLVGDNPEALARYFQGSAAFNPLASNVPASIKQMCARGELRCKRKQRGSVASDGVMGGSTSYEVEVQDYSLAMADFVLKEKAKEKGKFQKLLQDALARGAADEDWIAFHREKEKLEKEFAPRLIEEARTLGKSQAQLKQGEQTPVQKEYAARIFEVYGRTMRAAQVSDSILEHSGIQNHATADEKKSMREAVKSYFKDMKSNPQAGKRLEGRMVEIEASVLSRQSGLSVEQVKEDPVSARFLMRKKDLKAGLAAEGIDTERLPDGVKSAVDEVLREKLDLESQFGLASDRDSKTQGSLERMDMQLEALLYGIQMGSKEPPVTQAAIEKHARRFLGSDEGATLRENPATQLDSALQVLDQSQAKDRREYDARNAGRSPAVVEPSSSRAPAVKGSAGTAR